MKNDLTFSEVASLWVHDKRTYVKRSSLALYAVHLRKHLVPVFGSQTSVSEREVQEFVNRLLQEGLNPKTVKDILMVLNMVLRFASRYHEWETPSMDIRFPSARAKPGLQVLPLEQQRKLMQYLSRHVSPYNVGIALSLGTGMRIGELCALTWKDIDLSAGILHVTKTLQRIYLGQERTEVVVDSPKTRESYREIPLSGCLVSMLYQLKQEAGPKDYVLTGSPKPTEPGPYRRYFQRLLRQLDIPPIHFHGLRHSFATRCIESDCDYKTVSALLGHASVNTTLNLYVHPGLAQKKKCVNRAAKDLL